MRLIPLLFLSFFLLKSAFAQNAEIPFSGGRPQVEYKQTGNTYQWKPVTGKMPSQGVVFGSGHGVSNVEPKINTQGKLPYSTKPGASTGPLKVASKISPGKFGKAAAGVLAGAAATWPVQVALGLGAVTCNIYCDDLAQIMKDKGLDNFRKDENGDLEFLVSDSNSSNFKPSNGYYYSCSTFPDKYLSPYQCFPLFKDHFNSAGWDIVDIYFSDYSDSASTLRVTLLDKSGSKGYMNVNKLGVSTCPADRKVDLSTGQCFEPNDGRYSKKSWQELEDLFGGYAENMGDWGNSRAPNLAAKLAPHYDILDDSPSEVTGPASAPISETTTRESVNLSPGTNTPVSPGHTGPTDSGTRTTTKTTTAQNTYSGDTMTTTTVTNTTTNITNNITNNTTNVGTTTEESDKEPEKEDEAQDTDLPGVPELYEQKYPDGISGVWNKAKSDLNSSQLFSLVYSLTPDLADGGSCPSWNLDLSWTPGGSMGSYEIGSSFCFIWPILRVIVLITALFTARLLIFGG